MAKEKSNLRVFFWTYILITFTILAVITTSAVDRAMESEYQYVTTDLSKDAAKFVYTKATNAYNYIAFEKDIANTIERFLIPTQEEKDNSVGMKNMGNMLFDYVKSRLDILWRIFFQFLVRFWATSIWLPITLFCLVIPSIACGLQIRNRKKLTIEYSSPLKNKATLTFVWAGLVTLVTIFFLPVPIRPLIFPAVIGLCGALLGVSAANIPKRL